MKYSPKFNNKLSKKAQKKIKRKRRNSKAKKKFIMKKKIPSKLFLIETPYNSNEYLIENQSTPFFDEEDKEEDFHFFPCELSNINIDEIKDFISYKNESTNDSSNINEDLGKNLIYSKDLINNGINY